MARTLRLLLETRKQIKTLQSSVDDGFHSHELIKEGDILAFLYFEDETGHCVPSRSKGAFVHIELSPGPVYFAPRCRYPVVGCPRRSTKQIETT